MRNSVAFQYSEPFVPLPDGDTLLSVEGARWFVALLRRVPGLQVSDKLCQEDWGVVAFVERDQKQGWVGLSFWPEGEHGWLGHIHHRGVRGWLRSFRRAGKRELHGLISDFHTLLMSDPRISEMAWYQERDMTKAGASGTPTPLEP